MSVWIVVTRPIASVAPGHVEEARRAQRGPAAASRDALVDALWIARTLPLALDALTDARAGLDLTTQTVVPRRVERRDDAPAGPLVATALHEAGSARLEVRVAPRERAGDGDVPREQCPVVVEFALPGASDTAGASSDMVVRRFTHGRKATTR